jgi:adenylate cyclase
MEHGLPDYLALATMLHGWALAKQGQAKEGIIKIRQALDPGHFFGGIFLRPYHLALLAEAQSQAGRFGEGLNTLTEALTISEKSEEHWYDAELYRLKGGLMLQRETKDWRLETGPSSAQASSLKSLASPAVVQEAEGCFLKAIDIARKQQAKSLELRATMSLVRLRQQQTSEHAPRARLAEAHQMLSEIYGWFTEGFDTADLQDAKRLIEELS